MMDEYGEIGNGTASAARHDALEEAASSIKELNENLRRLAKLLNGDTSGTMGGIGAEIAEIDRNLHEIERLLEGVNGS
jgi:hypothetical protein